MKKILLVAMIVVVVFVVSSVVAKIVMSYPEITAQIASTQLAGSIHLEPQVETTITRLGYGNLDKKNNPGAEVVFRVVVPRTGLLSVWVVSQSPATGETRADKIVNDKLVTTEWTSNPIRAGGSASRHLVVAVLSAKAEAVTFSPEGTVTYKKGLEFGLGLNYFSYRPNKPRKLPPGFRVKSF